MLTKEKSNKTKLVKYITIIPIVLSMLVYVSCSDALEVDNTNEVTVSSETSVIEDVSKLVYNTLPHDIKKEDITEEQYSLITTKLEKYINNNEEKIENTDLRKYINYYLNSRDLNNPNNISEEEKELLTFSMGEMYTSILIKELKRDSDIEKIKRTLSYITSSKLNNKLQEFNYILPNEAKWQALYEDYLNNVSIETEEVNKDYSNQSEVPFSVIDQSPIYPECDENATFEELKKCFSKGIAKHINENFNTDIGKKHNLKGRQKIYISFKVDKLGRLKDVKARAPHEALKTEVIRVMNTLPELKPGMHNGKVVTVPFSIPVIFEVN